jgi:hypothetical protein
MIKILAVALMNHRNVCPLLSGAFKDSLKRDVPYFKKGLFSRKIKGATMNEEKAVETGIKSLVEEYRAAFRIAENLEYYLDEDYKFAEKQFIRYALTECRLDFLQ